MDGTRKGSAVQLAHGGPKPQQERPTPQLRLVGTSFEVVVHPRLLNHGHFRRSASERGRNTAHGHSRRKRPKWFAATTKVSFRTTGNNAAQA